LKPGVAAEWTQLTAAPKYTKAAGRYTEATLIRELEQKGIGRPSTFASLVETLLEKEYVEKKDIAGTTAQLTTLTLRPAHWPPEPTVKQQKVGAEKGKLVPTALGQSALAFCVREFPQLFGYTFTAEMEADLDAVSRGERAWKDVCRKTWGSYKEKYTTLKSTKPSVLQEGKQKDFGGGLKAVMTKKGPLILQEADTNDGITTFYSWPEGIAFEGVTEEVVRSAVAAQSTARIQFGSYKEKPIIKKKGPYGEYVECGILKVPITADDTRESVLAKLAAREAGAADEVRVGAYTFRKGQYGPYMYKTALKQKVFVKVPESLDIKKLTAAQADELYKAGAEAAKARGAGRAPNWRGGRGGGHGAQGERKTEG
jgi:DNA topoisomerase-1